MSERRIDIFGHRFVAERRAGHWALRHPDAEGRRGAPFHLPIPFDVVTDDALVDYLADLCHEWATPARDRVRWLDAP